MRNIQAGPLEDFTLKKLEAEGRLAVTFASFLITDAGKCIVVAAPVAPARIDATNFVGLIVGASHKDVDEALDVVRGICARISNTFSEEDVHARMVATIVTDYFQYVAQDLKIPVALACEIFIYDTHNQTLFPIRLTGEFDEISTKTSDEKMFFIGGYSVRLRKKLKRELERMPSLREAEQNKKPMNQFIGRIRKLTNMKFVHVLSLKK